MQKFEHSENGTLSLNQFGTEEAVRDVLKVGAVIRIKKKERTSVLYTTSPQEVFTIM